MPPPGKTPGYTNSKPACAGTFPEKRAAPSSPWSCLKKLYSRADIFGVNLYDAGLGEQVEGMVKELYEGPGAVRRTLHKYVWAR